MAAPHKMEKPYPLPHKLWQGVIFMVGTYEIKQGTRCIGKVTVEKQGLYYRFSCRCALTGEVMHHLLVTCGERSEDLGICVPVDGQFGLEKKIPCKRLGTGNPEFQLLPKHQKMQGKFIPVYPEEPFSYMSRLKDAFLEIRAGQMGIIIRE